MANVLIVGTLCLLATQSILAQSDCVCGNSRFTCVKGNRGLFVDCLAIPASPRNCPAGFMVPTTFTGSSATPICTEASGDTVTVVDIPVGLAESVCNAYPCVNSACPCMAAVGDPFMCGVTTDPNCDPDRTLPDECEADTCGPNGICMQSDSGVTCSCTLGFLGPQCDISSDLCLKGGFAIIELIDGEYCFSCSCPPEFTGTLCEADAPPPTTEPPVPTTTPAPVAPTCSRLFMWILSRIRRSYPIDDSCIVERVPGVCSINYLDCDCVPLCLRQSHCVSGTPNCQAGIFTYSFVRRIFGFGIALQ